MLNFTRVAAAPAFTLMLSAVWLSGQKMQVETLKREAVGWIEANPTLEEV